MEKRLFTYFLFGILAMGLVVILISLLEPKGKKINLQEVSFSTKEGSQLYFKNMRSFFYDKEVREDANFILYRIDSRELDSAENDLSFVLISNWLQSESYIMAESRFNFNESWPLEIHWENKTDEGVLQLTEKDSYSNYVFAAQLYEQLTTGSALTLKFKEVKHSLTEKELKSLKKTLKDYFKLVGKLR